MKSAMLFEEMHISVGARHALEYQNEYADHPGEWILTFGTWTLGQICNWLHLWASHGK